MFWSVVVVFGFNLGTSMSTPTIVDRIDPFAKRSLKKKTKKSQGSSRYRNSQDVELQPLPLLKGKWSLLLVVLNSLHFVFVIIYPEFIDVFHSLNPDLVQTSILWCRRSVRRSFALVVFYSFTVSEKYKQILHEFQDRGRQEFLFVTGLI